MTHWTNTTMYIIAKWNNVKSNKHIDSSEESSDKYPKFKIVDIVKISKYKNILARNYILN